MKQIIKAFAAVLFIGTAALAQPTFHAHAYYYSPYLQMTAVSSSDFRITINSAAPYNSITLYTRQDNSTLWSSINSIGTTDYNGYFSTILTINSFTPELTRVSYVTIANQDSNTVNIPPFIFNPPPFWQW